MININSKILLKYIIIICQFNLIHIYLFFNLKNK
jgi:hypothetical protein